MPKDTLKEFDDWIDGYTGKHKYEEGTLGWSLYEDTITIRKDLVIKKVIEIIEQTKKEERDRIFKYLDERKHHGFVKMKYVKELL